MRMRRRSRAPVMVLLATIALAGMLVAVAPFAVAHSVPGPLAAVDFVDAWTNDDGTGGGGDDGGPVGMYDGWLGASSADPSGPGFDPTRADKDVAICTAAVSLTDPNVVDVTVQHAYPGYHCTFQVTVANGATIPATVEAVVLAADPELVFTDEDPHLPATLGPGEENDAAYTVEVLQAAGENTTLHASVTITVTAEFGSIIVEKVTDPAGSDEEFEFDPSWGANFILEDGESYDSGLLPPGKYSVEEVDLPEDWIEAASYCVVMDAEPVVYMDPSNITLGEGQTIVCTFENFDTGSLDPRPALVIVKDAIPADNTVFWFSVTGQAGFSLQDPWNPVKVFTNLPEGAYTITELTTGLDTSWKLVGIDCIADDWEKVGRSATVTLGEGEIGICTFRNIERLPPTGAPDWAVPVGAGGLTALIAGLLMIIFWRRTRESED